MGRGKKTQNPHNQEFRSPILADKFQKLQDDLILTIFSKLQDDTKSLIRCSSVSKKWASLVSKLDTVSLRFFIPTGDEDSPMCFQSHLHIPISAIPALMKVFSNLKSLEVKVCHTHPSEKYTYRLKGMLVVGSEVRSYLTRLLVTSDIGFSATSNDAAWFKPAWFKPPVTKPNRSFLGLYVFILSNCPETLTNVVITSCKIQGFGSEGMVFMTMEQQRKFCDFILNSRVNWSWLENPENVVYWLKKDSLNALREQIWIVRQWEYTKTLDGKLAVLYDRIPEEIDIKELLEGLDDDNDD